MPTKEEVIDVLKTVFDPEIPVNVYDLGFIYDITIDGGQVSILMTLTVPGCPLHAVISKEVKEKVEAMNGVDNTNVTITFDPRWSVDKITEDGKKRLRGENRIQRALLIK